MPGFVTQARPWQFADAGAAAAGLFPRFGAAAIEVPIFHK
jgi:hypothetical protein